MYERNAIVLERYFGKKLGYQEQYNLKNNFYNYCELLDKIESYNLMVESETEASKDFVNVSAELKGIATSQEKLYKRSAKLEYSRNLLFSNIEENAQELEKCLLKIELDIEKTQEALKELRIKFIETVEKYQDRKKHLEEVRNNKSLAEEEYENCLNQTKANYEGQNTDVLTYIKGITTDEVRRVKRELIDVITKNGEKEKIPFDADVVSKASEFATEISKKEADCYIIIYEKVKKLLEEIETNTLKIERHKKWKRDNLAKIKFFNSERDYLIQFLDNERLPVMHGKKVHRKLMIEACKNLLLDVAQMNNLYELILREEAGRSAKKAYKELYNKDYLSKIEEKEQQFENEAASLNLNAATVINSNYWRVEGIREVYTTFYQIITEIYERDLEEFEVQIKEPEIKQEDPEDIVELELPRAKTIEEITDDDDDNEYNEDDEDSDLKIIEIKKSSKVKEKISESIDDKIKELEDTDEDIEDNEDEENEVVEKDEENQDDEVEEKEDKENVDIFVGYELRKKNEKIDEDMSYEDEEIFEEDEDIEESLLEPILKAKETEQDLKAALEAVKGKQSKKKKTGIFKNIIKMNNKKHNAVE
jgi:hypothetical protein